MQVAAEPAALLLACRYQALASASQVGGEEYCVGRDPDLADQVFEQPQVLDFVNDSLGPRGASTNWSMVSEPYVRGRTSGSSTGSLCSAAVFERFSSPQRD